MDIKEIWEADRLRTERVRALQEGPELDGAMRIAANITEMSWAGVSVLLPAARSAVEWLQHAHADRVEAFAQRILDEVAPWATSYNSAIELTTPEMPVGTGLDGGSYTVMAILTAEPAAIVRAIILSLPER